MMRNKKKTVMAKDVTGIQGPHTLVLGAFAYYRLEPTCNYQKSDVAGRTLGEGPYLRC
jgi:hypothetical protein